MAVALAAGALAAGCQLEDAGAEAELAASSAALATGRRVACEPKSTPRLLQATSTRRLYTFTETLDTLTFSEQRVASGEYDQFLAYLEDIASAAGVDVFDQHALLERQRDIFVEFLGPEEGEPFDLLLSGAVGEITPVTCLQSILFDLQNRDFPVWEEPTETGAMVLTRGFGSVTLVRVYVLTQQGNASISFHDVLPRVRADVEAGWDLRAHFHSHPFAPDNPIDIAGTTIPSSADASTYRSLRDELDLQEAWITNGIHSLRLGAGEFDFDL